MTNLLERILGRFADVSVWCQECENAGAGPDAVVSAATHTVIDLHTTGTRKRLGDVYTTIDGAELAARIEHEAGCRRACGLVRISQLETMRSVTPAERDLVLKAIGLVPVFRPWWGRESYGTLRQQRRCQETYAVRAALIEIQRPQTLDELVLATGLDRRVVRARVGADTKCHRPSRGVSELTREARAELPR